jgi:hypothetical protein
MKLNKCCKPFAAALMDMVNQFFHDGGDGVLFHSFMAAEEEAIAVLVQAELAEVIEPGKNGYRLMWEKLTDNSTHEERLKVQAPKGPPNEMVSKGGKIQEKKV